jgi:trehalose 6-phosphate phosphatase
LLSVAVPGEAGHIGAVPRHAKTPPLTPNSAIFLDIDGTLLDIAPTPEAVRMPAGLPELLRGLSARLGGALGLISGRSLADIDALFGSGLPVAAEHGAIIRDAAGQIVESVKRPASLDAIAARLRAEVAARPGTLLEEKRFGIALHWRGAPEQSIELGALAADLVATKPDLVLLAAHQAIEIRAHGANKGAALEALMRTRPFAGRVPAFIGDDVTDEVAIETARRMGGIGLHVSRDFGGSTQAVRSWLAGALEAGNV